MLISSVAPASNGGHDVRGTFDERRDTRTMGDEHSNTMLHAGSNHASMNGTSGMPPGEALTASAASAMSDPSMNDTPGHHRPMDMSEYLDPGVSTYRDIRADGSLASEMDPGTSGYRPTGTDS